MLLAHFYAPDARGRHLMIRRSGSVVVQKSLVVVSMQGERQQATIGASALEMLKNLNRAHGHGWCCENWLNSRLEEWSAPIGP
jgi:hypothetical protein